MKKEYIAPDAFVVEMKQQNSILIGSNPYRGGTPNNGDMNGPIDDSDYDGPVK